MAYTFDDMMKRNEEQYKFAKEVLKDCKLMESHHWPGYAHTEYKLVYQPIPDRVKELTAEHGALLADCGNLCFGGRSYSKYVEDGKLIFTGIYHTD